MSSYSLQGKTIFITGGANGIGAATARQAAKRGARLAIVDLAMDAAEQLAASLPDAIAIEGDVRDYDSLVSATKKAVEAFGGVDVVMANAGIERIATAESATLEEIEQIVDVNFTGVFRTAKATLPHVADRRGYFLITASLAAVIHTPPLSHYAATKAGVEAFGNAVRIEMQQRGVDVGVAYFGIIDTNMVARSYENKALTDWREAHPRAQRGPLGKTYPVDAAARAVVRGMENRSRRVMCPRFIRIPMMLRALMPRAAEAVLHREGADAVIRALNEAGPDSPQAAKAIREEVKS